MPRMTRARGVGVAQFVKSQRTHLSVVASGPEPPLMVRSAPRCRRPAQKALAHARFPSGDAIEKLAASSVTSTELGLPSRASRAYADSRPRKQFAAISRGPRADPRHVAALDYPELRDCRPDRIGDVTGNQMGIVPLRHSSVGVTEICCDDGERHPGAQEQRGVGMLEFTNEVQRIRLPRAVFRDFAISPSLA
jgi:hypothetical protein